MTIWTNSYLGAYGGYTPLGVLAGTPASEFWARVGNGKFQEAVSPGAVR